MPSTEKCKTPQEPSYPDGYYDPKQHSSFEQFMVQREDPYALPLRSGLCQSHMQLIRVNGRLGLKFSSGGKVTFHDLRDFKGHRMHCRPELTLPSQAYAVLHRVRTGSIVSFTARMIVNDQRLVLRDIHDAQVDWQPSETTEIACGQTV